MVDRQQAAGVVDSGRQAAASSQTERHSVCVCVSCGCRQGQGRWRGGRGRELHGASYMGLWRLPSLMRCSYILHIYTTYEELHGALEVAVLNLHDLAHLVEDREDVVLL